MLTQNFLKLAWGRKQCLVLNTYFEESIAVEAIRWYQAQKWPSRTRTIGNVSVNGSGIDKHNYALCCPVRVLFAHHVFGIVQQLLHSWMASIFLSMTLTVTGPTSKWFIHAVFSYVSLHHQTAYNYLWTKKSMPTWSCWILTICTSMNIHNFLVDPNSLLNSVGHLFIAI